eukprot:70988-Pleurochrysis_carterae.AAC.2
MTWHGFEWHVATHCANSNALGMVADKKMKRISLGSRMIHSCSRQRHGRSASGRLICCRAVSAKWLCSTSTEQLCGVSSVCARRRHMTEFQRDRRPP